MPSATKVRFCGLQRQGNVIHFALLTMMGGEFIPGGVVCCTIEGSRIHYHAKIGTRPLAEVAETDVQVSLREFAQELATLGASQVQVNPRAGKVHFPMSELCQEHFARVGQLADRAYLARHKGSPRQTKIGPKSPTHFVPNTATS